MLKYIKKITLFSLILNSITYGMNDINQPFKVETSFKKATDKKATNKNPLDDQYNKLFHYISGSDIEILYNSKIYKA